MNEMIEVTINDQSFRVRVVVTHRPVQFECGCMQGDDGSVSDSQSESEDIVTPAPGLNAGMPKMTECQSRGSESKGRSVDGHGDSFCSMQGIKLRTATAITAAILQ
ncbi:hypothetical protein V6N13_147992 [Hibiscus sabdariffa]